MLYACFPASIGTVEKFRQNWHSALNSRMVRKFTRLIWIFAVLQDSSVDQKRSDMRVSEVFSMGGGCEEYSCGHGCHYGHGGYYSGYYPDYGRWSYHYYNGNYGGYYYGGYGYSRSHGLLGILG
jgi:hypothetical protein